MVIFQTDNLGDENEGGIFAWDESLFNHTKEEQILILGIINTSTKEFGLEAILKRDEFTLKKFVETYVKKGNSRVT